MPHHELAKRPDVAKIKPVPGKTTSYSDPSLKSDPDARGIRLMVGATTKTWVITRRIDDKVRTITLPSMTASGSNRSTVASSMRSMSAAATRR